MRLSISILCLIFLILLKHCYSFICENAGCNTGYERCVCSDCDETNTVGIIYSGKCFFIELNRTSKSLNVPEQTDNVTDSIATLHDVVEKGMTQRYSTVIQILTRHAYKSLDIKHIAFEATTAETLFEVDLHTSFFTKSRCAVYQVKKHKFHLSTHDKCASIEKVFVDSEYHHGSAYSFSLTKYDHRQFDKTKHYSCFPSKSPRGCAFLQYTTSQCPKLFKVLNRASYQFMENFSLYKLKEDTIMYKAFLVEFDPKKYHLTKEDYYMDIHSSSNTSGPSCYIADVIAGKLISQSSCKEAISNLKSQYFYDLDSYTSMCRVPSKQLDEYLKPSEIQTTTSTVVDSEKTYDDYTIISESSMDNGTITVFRNTSEFDAVNSTQSDENVTISTTHLIEDNSTTVSTSTPDIDDTTEPAESDYYLIALKILFLTLVCLIFFIIILTCKKKT